MLVEELKDRVTSTEFVEWCTYLEMEEETTTKMDVYLAQIAVENRRSFVKNPRDIHIKDFIMDFTPKKPYSISDSKHYWMTLAGVRKDK